MIRIILAIASIIRPSRAFGFVSQGRHSFASANSAQKKSSLVRGFSLFPEEGSIESFDCDYIESRRLEFFLLNDTSNTPSMQHSTVSNDNEEECPSKFKSGDYLIELREEVALRREKLRDAQLYLDSLQEHQFLEMNIANQLIQDIKSDITAVCSQDAEFMYVHMSTVAMSAERRNDLGEVKRSHLEAEEARKNIPQLNLHGLWIGKYGDDGYEMVNITYIGDTLIATKITGDEFVPRGEDSFKCDLSPRLEFKSLSYLEPIELTDEESSQCGNRYLPRYFGKGQVANKRHQNAQWVDGQLILIGNCFSFIWLPIHHQVFFSRPTPEVVLDMFRRQERDELKKDPVSKMRLEAQAMMDKTFWHEDKSKRDFKEEGKFE